MATEDSSSSSSSTDSEEENNRQYFRSIHEAVLSVRRLVLQYKDPERPLSEILEERFKGYIRRDLMTCFNRLWMDTNVENVQSVFGKLAGLGVYTPQEMEYLKEAHDAVLEKDRVLFSRFRQRGIVTPSDSSEDLYSSETTTSSSADSPDEWVECSSSSSSSSAGADPFEDAEQPEISAASQNLSDAAKDG